MGSKRRIHSAFIAACIAAAFSCQQDATRSERDEKDGKKDTGQTDVTHNGDLGAEANDKTSLPPITGAEPSTSSPVAPPPVGQKSEKRRITFTGSRSDQVPGYLWLPAGGRGQRHPAIFMMYGIKGNKDDATIAKAAERLQTEGFVVMTIDWPGTGERGQIGNAQRITDLSVLTWTVADYAQAVTYLQTQPEVDPAKIGFVGASMGAMTGLAFAGRDPRIKTVVAVVPIPNPLWGNDDPSVRIRSLAPRTVLCLATADNSDFSGLVCANVGPGGVSKVLAGGHELQGFQGEVIETATAFLKQNLR